MRNYLNWNNEMLDVKSVKVSFYGKTLSDEKFHNKKEIANKQFKHCCSLNCKYCMGGTESYCFDTLLTKDRYPREYEFIIRV